ncbi:MAG: MFS transporter [Curvibacter sp. GWA2_64_110]|nr:MAG: MFS transporter [Curvibacter sp. GWA2_64_110]HCY16286.1 MFS transporter [Curvibacter sp.]
MTMLSRRTAVVVFLAFAFAYFFSALIRAITATLSPTLTQEFALNARDLGLLAGGYFLGFAAMQLPLGNWLDRHGPKKVILSFLAVAVAGCVAFSWATSFAGLLLARILCGVGLGACLMAPLTGYRRWFGATTQLRTNSWMLMTGSMGMVASTLPVQWLMPLLGWRPLFWGLAGTMALSMAVIAWQVPSWQVPPSAVGQAQPQRSYAEVWRHPYFRKMTPIGFVNYGGMVAIQTLWAMPWMIRVAGYTPEQAATGLFWLNVAMLLTFWSWGLLNPWLARRGFSADRLITLGTPLSLLLLAILCIAGDAHSSWSGALLVLFCVSSTFISLAQPAVGMAFPPDLAGRALSAYNLVIFSGIFVVQWGIGLLIDGLQALGWAQARAFQGALAVFLTLCAISYMYFLAAKSHNQASTAS